MSTLVDYGPMEFTKPADAAPLAPLTRLARPNH